MNDKPLSLSHCSCDLYADDTSAFVIDKDVTAIELKLNVDADNLYKWCTVNIIRINLI